jgi:DNA-binding NtrC family response regulator
VRLLPAGAVEVSPCAGIRMPVSAIVRASGQASPLRPLVPGERLQAGDRIALGDRVVLEVGTRLAEPAERTLDADLGLVGRSDAMTALRAAIRAVSTFEDPVLVMGETGTGKELIARALHDLSGARGKFIGINTAGLDEGTATSELFGHVRGAFTGAQADRAGAFELARRGTLFLDEIGDMSPDLQKRLLRVLELRRYARMGTHEDWPLDTRIIAATHRPFATAIASGAFRRDLFERLRALTIEPPPLRERRGDIPLLFAHALLAIAHGRPELAWLVTPPDLARAAPIPLEWWLGLESRPFRGNVRELKNLATAVAAANLTPGPFRPSAAWNDDTADELPSTASARKPAAALPDDAAIDAALREHAGRVQDAATALGCSRFQLYRWLNTQDKSLEDYR